MTDRRLLAAIGASGLLNLVVLGSPFLLHTYDAQTHIFFADHYLHDWFNPWEPKWFDGMWMFTYPPLVHQLIALVGALTGVEVAYRIVQGVALIAFPVSVYHLALETLGPRCAGWAAILAVCVPGIYVELYTWGQLPSFVGMVLAIAGAAFFGRYLRTGRGIALTACALLTGAATAAHHHAVVFVMPLLMAGMAGRWWLQRKRGLRIGLRRPLAAGLSGAALAALAILPFVWWIFNHYLPQAELPHPTRDGIFRTSIDSELFFWGMYGAFIVLAPAGLILLVLRRRAWLPVAVVLVLLGVLGLGTLTPLPRLLFGVGDLWKWLVYERFAVWAAVLCALPASVVVQRLISSRLQWPAAAIISGVLLFGVAREATFGVSQPLVRRPLQPWEETEILKFLATDHQADWNYVTIGLGEAEMARISRLTSARTMDGLYYTARERPELRASGVGSIDSAYWWRTGLEILPQVLQQPQNWNLKWAIVALPPMEEQFRAAGWRQLFTLGSPVSLAHLPSLFFQQSADTQAAFRAIYGDQAALAWAAEHGAPPVTSLVSVWQAPDRVDVVVLEPSSPPAYPTWLAVWWGTVPLLLLLSAVIAVVASAWGVRVVPRPAPRVPELPQVEPA